MLKIINPATEELIKEIPEDTPQSIATRFQQAKKAQKSWARLSVDERINKVATFRQNLVDNRSSLAQTLTEEMGKPFQQSVNEIKGVLERVDFFLDNMFSYYDNQIVFQQENLVEKITREPLGVIANISAWNYPYFVGSNVFVPALLTGNAVLYKPSEFATLTGLAISEQIHAAGIPEDIFVPIIGAGSVGAELLKQPLNGVFFTGSYGTGLKVAQEAASQLCRVQLELGGKDPVYVCEDVDAPIAAETLVGDVFYNAGQSCCAVERIYVRREIAETFIDAFVQKTQEIYVGNPLDERVTLGPLARQPQLAILEEQVQDALSKGARLMTGGKREDGKGYFFEPTVLTEVNHQMNVMKEESFGPIIGIQVVESDEEAIQLMNDTAYGLTSSIFTHDEQRATQVLSAMNSGSVYWNCCDRVSPRLPWTGRGHSGLGSTLSHYGIETFFQPKAWHMKRR